MRTMLLTLLSTALLAAAAPAQTDTEQRAADTYGGAPRETREAGRGATKVRGELAELKRDIESQWAIADEGTKRRLEKLRERANELEEKMQSSDTRPEKEMRDHEKKLDKKMRELRDELRQIRERGGRR